MRRVVSIVIVLLVAGLAAWWAFGGERPHGKPPVLPEKLDPKALAAVGAAYDKDIQPIFKKACFDCHTKDTVWPWYHSIPGVKQYLDMHVNEGLDGLDLSKGFPFNSDVHPMRHLRRIGRQVGEGDMPLWDYRLMHPAARLSDAEKQAVVSWAQNGFDELSRTAQVLAAAPQGKSRKKH